MAELNPNIIGRDSILTQNMICRIYELRKKKEYGSKKNYN